jgi:hypothetical protein
MKRLLIVVAAVIGGVALLGAGIVVGSKIGQEQAIVAAADAQGPLTEKDAIVLSTFSDAGAKFEKLLLKAKDGKKVGDELTRQAVIVLHVERAAEGPKFKEAAGAAGDAMLLLSAGLIADDGATVEQGLAEYKASQEMTVALAEEIQEANGEQSDSEGDGENPDTDDSGADSEDG